MVEDFLTQFNRRLYISAHDIWRLFWDTLYMLRFSFKLKAPNTELLIEDIYFQDGYVQNINTFIHIFKMIIKL